LTETGFAAFPLDCLGHRMLIDTRQRHVEPHAINYQQEDGEPDLPPQLGDL
jgi:hypothetical protein